MGPGRSAEMTYYETPAGAKVFAAGSLDFAASIGEPVVAQLVENLWARLVAPLGRPVPSKNPSPDSCGQGGLAAAIFTITLRGCHPVLA